jgi:hypothetical protein
MHNLKQFTSSMTGEPPSPVTTTLQTGKSLVPDARSALRMQEVKPHGLVFS